MNAYRLRREVLRLATAVMEAAWFWAVWQVAYGLFSPQSQAPSFFMTTLLMVLAVFTARYLDLGRAGGAPQAVAVAVVIGVTMFLGAAAVGLGGPGPYLLGLRDFQDPHILYTLGYLALWWRGISLVGGGFGAELTGFRFRVGVIILMWALVAAAFTAVSITLAVFVMFGAALLAMGLARVEDVSRDVAGVATPFDRAWLAILIGAMLMVMLLGGLATVLFSADSIRTILGWFGPLWNLLAAILVGILYVLLVILTPFIEALARALRPVLENLPLRLPQPPPGGEEEVTQAASILPEAVGMGLRWGLLALGLLAAVALLGLWAQRRRQVHLEPIPELRESVWSADAFAQDARALLDRALARLRREQRSHAADTVRHIYAMLQALAAAHGAPRPPDDTPYEYLPTLVTAFPEAEGDLQRLTDAYVDAHYHELPTSDAQLAEARAAWERVRRVIERAPAPREATTAD